jgi:hypothetical protein
LNLTSDGIAALRRRGLDPKCIGDFLYDDLDHNVVTDTKNNADDISCVNLVDKHNDDTCDVYDTIAYALTRDAEQIVQLRLRV